MEHDRVTVRVDTTGARPVVTKEATGGAAATRVRHEITMLELARHPGVVALIDHSDTDAGVVMATRFCGSRTLANSSPLPLPRAAGVMAALATTVADLHELGIVHGRITADHVLISADGRPVLCGFADAATGDDATIMTADDVNALGLLLHEILAPHDDVAPIPNSRIGRRGAWSGYQRRALLNLADQATADDPFVRPSARQLAHNLRAAVPDATLYDTTSTSDAIAALQRDADEDDPPTRWARLIGSASPRTSRGLLSAGVGTAGLIAVLTFAALVFVPANASVTPARDDSGGQEAVAAGTDQTPTSVPAMDHTAPGPLHERFPDAAESVDTPPPPGSVEQQPVPNRSGVDAAVGCSASTDDHASSATTADGHLCPVDVTLVDGVLTIDGESFDLGLPSAAVAIGDFACDGGAQAGVVDLLTGDVFVFPRWAGDGETVTATVLTRVDDARRLLAEPIGDCHRLVTLDRFGIRHVIDTANRLEPS